MLICKIIGQTARELSATARVTFGGNLVKLFYKIIAPNALHG